MRLLCHIHGLADIFLSLLVQRAVVGNELGFVGGVVFDWLRWLTEFCFHDFLQAALHERDNGLRLVLDSVVIAIIFDFLHSCLSIGNFQIIAHFRLAISKYSHIFGWQFQNNYEYTIGKFQT